MNFSEFKKRIGAEPRSDAREIHEARAADPAFDAAAREAETFEDGLEAALRVPVDEDTLLDDLLATPVRAGPRGLPRWLALAASLLVVVGVAAVGWKQVSAPRTVESYVQQHYLHDGQDVLAQAGEAVAQDQINAIFASLGVRANAELMEKIRYIKFCPTLHGRGAHMVLSSSTGSTTIIYMPDTTIEAPILVQFDGTDARIVSLAKGSAAIIGDPAEVRSLQTLVRGSVTPLTADA